MSNVINNNGHEKNEQKTASYRQNKRVQFTDLRYGTKKTIFFSLKTTKMTLEKHQETYLQ